MDLGAFVRIRDFKQLADRNDISVPRTRGYRWMAMEEPIPDEQIAEAVEAITDSCCDRMARTKPKFALHPELVEYSLRTDKMVEQYMNITVERHKDDNGREYEVKHLEPKWELLSETETSNLHAAIEGAREQCEAQYRLFNEYVGKKDILYIHARVGSGNSSKYKWEQLASKPWFIAGIDDCFDDTYCDVYARLHDLPKEVEENMVRKITEKRKES